MDGEDSLGAPASSVYECHSRGIVDTLNDLFDKAEVQLDDARKTDQMLKQSLVDEVKYASKEMPEAKHCGIWRKESCDSKSAEADGKDSLGAPASSLYECHSGGIVDTLDDLFDEAEVQPILLLSMLSH